MVPEIFIDTSIVIRFLTRDVEHQFLEAERLFVAMRDGNLRGRIEPSVISEIVHVLGKHYGVERADIASAVNDLLLLDGFTVSDAEEIAVALQLWQQMRRLSFADAMHIAYARNLDAGIIASFDKGLDRVDPVVTRIQNIAQVEASISKARLIANRLSVDN